MSTARRPLRRRVLVLALGAATAAPGAVIAPTPAQAATTGQFWTAWRGGSPIYSARGSGRVATLPVNYALTGTISTSSGGWMKISSGRYAGRWIHGNHLTPSNPASPPKGNTAKRDPVRPVGMKLYRWPLALKYSPVVRSTAGFGNNIVGSVPSGTRLHGSYVNRSWFRIDSGRYAGRYISSGVIHYASTMTSVNGDLPAAALCPIPTSMHNSWEPTTRKYLSCASIAPLAALNAAFRRLVSSRGLTGSETYRSLGKQRFFYSLFGPSRAAVPGTSNHGLGTAFDLDTTRGAIFGYGTKADKFLTTYGRRYGFDRPAYMDKGGSKPEPWHYNFIG